MDTYDLIVIGGGISGLSLAHHALARKTQVCLLEGDTRVGGALHTFHPQQDFWLELGAHTAYNSYGGFLALAQAYGLADSRVERATSKWMLWENSRAYSIASRLHWGHIALRLPRLLTTRRQGRTVASYFTHVLGQRNYAQVLGPMLGAVASQRADEIPADLLFKKRPRQKDWPRSFTFRQGLGALPEAMQAVAPPTAAPPTGAGLHLYKGPAGLVLGITRSRGEWRVETADGSQHIAPRLALAIAPDSAAALLRSGAPDIAELLALLTMAKLYTVGVAAPSAQVTLPPLAGLVGLHAPFRSMVSRDTVPHQPSQGSPLRGFAFHFPGNESARGEMTQNAIIASVLGVGPRDWAFRVTAAQRLPAPRPGHQQRIAQLDALLAGSGYGGALLLTGNWFGGMAIEDCIARSRAEVTRVWGEA